MCHVIHHYRDCVLEGWLNFSSWRSFRSCVMRLSDWKPTVEQACPCTRYAGFELTHARLSSVTAAHGRAAGARLGRAQAVADFAHGVRYRQQLLVGQLPTHTLVRERRAQVQVQ